MDIARDSSRLARAVLIATCCAIAVPVSVVAQPQSQEQRGTATDNTGAPLPGTTIPCAPIAEKKQELGCYVLTRQRLGALPPGALSWHLDTFATRATAEAAKAERGTVVEAFDRTWLFTIAEPGWRPAAGLAAEHVATVTLPLETRAAEYGAVYMATTFHPGLSSFVHAHPGPEAWYVLSGEQCLETPEGRLVARAGQSMAVRGDLPMTVQATGTDIRRVLVLILHDAAKPGSARVDTWRPLGPCRP